MEFLIAQSHIGTNVKKTKIEEIKPYHKIGCYSPSGIQHISLAAQKIIYWYTGLHQVAMPYGVIRDHRLTALFLMCLAQGSFRLGIFDVYIERIKKHEITI